MQFVAQHISVASKAVSTRTLLSQAREECQLRDVFTHWAMSLTTVLGPAQESKIVSQAMPWFPGQKYYQAAFLQAAETGELMPRDGQALVPENLQPAGQTVYFLLKYFIGCGPPGNG